MSNIYNSIEYNKMLMETVEGGIYTIIYVGIARYAIPPYEKNGYRVEADKNKPIWMIRREKYNPITGVHDYSYPNLDAGYNYVRNDRASYDYDNKPGSVDGAIMLNDSDFLATEDLGIIGLETA